MNSLFAQHFPYHQFTVDDGLPSNFVYGATQDDDGYIWVFTDKGIAKFDGYNFKTYTVQDGLPTNDIWNMTKDHTGRLWLHCFSKSLAYLEQDSVRTFFKYDKTENAALYPVTIRLSEDAIMLLNNMNQEFIYINDSISFVPYDNFEKPALDNLIPQVAVVGYLSSDTIPNLPLSQYIPDRLLNIDKPPLLVSARQHYHFQNHLVYKSSNGIVYFNLLEGSYRQRFFDESYGGVPSFIDFQEVGETLQVYSDLNLQILDKNLLLVKEYNLKQFAKRGFTIRGSFQDKAGNIWVATREDGLLLITPKQQTTQMIHNQNITTILGIGEELLIGTAEGDMYIQNPTYENKLILKGEKYKNDIVKSAIARRDEGDFLFALELRGVFQYDMETEKITTIDDYLTTQNVFIYEDVVKGITYNLTVEEAQKLFERTFYALKDCIWDAPSNSIYEAANGQTWQFQFQKDTIKLRKIASNRSTTIAADGTGKIWIGHIYGLGSFEDDCYRFEGEKDIPLLNTYVNTLATDTLGNVWVGTDGYGIYGYNGQDIFEVEETKGDLVEDIYIDEEGYIWTSTNQGLKQLEVTFGDAKKTRLVRHFQTKDGLPTNAVNCVYVDNNYIYVGTDKGLIRLEKDSPTPQKQDIKLYLDKILINGKPVEEQERYILKYYQNELEMVFTALSFQSLEDIEYHYQLKNSDRTRQLKKNRRIRYSSLEAGNYQFEIYAKDAGNNISNVIELEVKIFPPWWRNVWFRMLMFCSIFGLFYGLYRYRIQTIKRREAEHSYFQQQIAAYELQALQAQMNPHFIFNSLTTIQYFIQRNDKKSATKYLITFGDLTRAFLEASKSRYISLEQELELLKMYIDLEQMRFNEKFETSIVIDEAVDIYTTEIPSMLLQPFVENSISHGFFHKEGKGHLNIHFQSNGENDGIICTIRDDGIGRERARLIKENSIRNHISRGTQIVDERLAVLNKMEGYDIKVNISDVYDAKQEVAGTNVQIKIPEITNFS